MTTKGLFGVALAALVAGCGGGGGGGTPFNDGANGSGLCTEPFFQRVIGTYGGQVTFGRQIDSNPEELLCEWDMSVQVRPWSNLPDICFLEAVVRSEVQQAVSYPASDRRAYQCQSPDALIRLNGRYGVAFDATSLSDITFPVFYDFFGELDAPSEGPYFNDSSVVVPYVHLFDSFDAVVDSLQFDGEGTLELVGTDDIGIDSRFREGKLQGTLESLSR